MLRVKSRHTHTRYQNANGGILHLLWAETVLSIFEGVRRGQIWALRQEQGCEES